MSLRNTLCASFFVAANMLFVFLVVFYEHHHLHAENALLENIQALFLLMGALFYLFLLPGNGPFTRQLHSALALLCLSFVLRELDLEHLPLPGVIQALGSGNGRTLLLLLLWAALARSWILGVADKMAFLRFVVGSGAFLSLVVTMLLLLASALIDSKVVTVQHPRLFEELAETNAYLLIVLPALSQLWVRYDLTRCVGFRS